MSIHRLLCITIVWMFLGSRGLAQLSVPPVEAMPALSSVQTSPAANVEQELAHVRELLEIQQKQIELLRKLAEATSQTVVEQPLSTDAAPLDMDVAKLKAGALQGARRDEDIANEIDRLTEGLDDLSRNGGPLPATLRETFLPSRFDQSPIVMYNTLQAGFTDFESEVANFSTPTWLPHFYMLFQENYQLQINPQINAENFELLSGQIDWFIRDDLTITVGRFYSPLGFFNDRLHTSWVIKTPNDPLVFEVIYPHQLSMNGLQLRGAKYIADLPVKLEYSGFTSNGFSLAGENPSAKDFADMRLMRKSFADVNDDKALGGRLGLSFPQVGLVVGASGMLNGAYDTAGEHDLSLVDYDASLHYQNWDIKFEYVDVSQQAPLRHIDRQGFYFQTAYRNYSSIDPLWGNTEFVFRLGHVEFNGIDLAVTGLDFGGTDHIPIDRNRYLMGTNYYFSPSLIAKIAYEINDELAQDEFDDNGLLAQVTWGF